MSEVHPIARQLLGDSDEDDRPVPCAVCGESTICPGFIVAAVRTWNEQHRDVERPIRPSEMGIACAGECTAKLFAQRHREVQQEHAQTDALWKMLLVGKYNPESLAWLRAHGYAKEVERVLNEEGQRRESERPAEPASKTVPPPAQKGFEYGNED